MSRPIKSRYRVDGTLVCQTPLHVGGAGSAGDVDLPLALNGKGDWYVPGTSLAGPLRRWHTAASDEQSANMLWGYVDQSRKALDHAAEATRNQRWRASALTRKGKGTNEEPRASTSYVLVEDATLIDPDVLSEVRDGVGIDRYSGRAAGGVKFEREVLPRGTRLTFGLTLECLDRRALTEEEKRRTAMMHGLMGWDIEPVSRLDDFLDFEVQARRQLGWLVAALGDGRVRIGSSKTRGLARVRLEDCRIVRWDLATREGMLALLRGEPMALTLDDLLKGSPRHTEPLLEIDIYWRPTGPVMMKAALEGFGVDMLPLVSADGPTLTSVLTGSGIKGPLRSHGERILATVLDVPALVEEADAPRRFLDQLERKRDVTPGIPLIETLFGAPAESEDGAASPEGPPLRGLGAISVDDCYAAQRLSPEQLRTIVSASPVESADSRQGGRADPSDDKNPLPMARKVVEKTGWYGFEPVAHNAIDRWTGGAADGFLYSVLEPPSRARWEPIRLTLDPQRLAASGRDQLKTSFRDQYGKAATLHGAAVALLMLTLRDLVLGRIPLGFGGNRGLGAIAIERIELRAIGAVADAIPPLRSLLGRTLTPGDFANTERCKALFADLDNCWSDYCRDALSGAKQ